MADERGKSKRPIDLLRDSAVGMTIGTPKDGPITNILQCGDRLLVVKARAVYEVMLADKIDPERTNAAVPDAQQRVLQVGSDSAILGRTLLTAEAFFQTKFLQHAINCDVAMAVAFEATQHLLAAVGEHARLTEEIETIDSGDTQLGGALSIPTVVDLEARCAAIIREAHRFARGAMGIAKLFYGEKITHPDSLLTHIEQDHAGNDEFLHFLNDAVPELRFLWSLRNTVEHPKADERVMTTNFVLNKDGVLVKPTIQIIHPINSLPPAPILSFFRWWTMDLATILELLIVHISVHHAKFGQFELAFAELPPERRQMPHVRYSYAINVEGRWLPVG